METRFLRSESPPEGRAKYRNNIPPTPIYILNERWHKRNRNVRTVTVSHNWYSFPRCSGTAIPTVFGVPPDVSCQDWGRMCRAWSGLVGMKSELGHSLTGCCCAHSFGWWKRFSIRLLLGSTSIRDGFQCQWDIFGVWGVCSEGFIWYFIWGSVTFKSWSTLSWMRVT